MIVVSDLSPIIGIRYAKFPEIPVGNLAMAYSRELPGIPAGLDNKSSAAMFSINHWVILILA